MEPVTKLYLDPSAGSLAFQILVGGVFATMAIFRRYWSRVAFWKRSRE